MSDNHAGDLGTTILFVDFNSITTSQLCQVSLDIIILYIFEGFFYTLLCQKELPLSIRRHYIGD